MTPVYEPGYDRDERSRRAEWRHPACPAPRLFLLRIIAMALMQRVAGALGWAAVAYALLYVAVQASL